MTGTTKNDVLGRLLARLEALEEENRAIRAELAALKPAPAAGPSREGQALSRRRALLTLGGAVAGAAALGRGLADPGAARAGTDGDLALGRSTNTASAPTGLGVTGATSDYGIGVTDNGLNQYPSVTRAALFGHAGFDNFGAGVLGYSNAGGIGVEGVSEAGAVPAAAGVYGLGSPGVRGLNVSGGAGIEGKGEPGVSGTAFDPSGVGVRGSVQGTDNPGTVPASGTGIVAEAVDGGGGPPTVDSVALLATNAGKGTGVKATSDSGIPLLAQVTNTKSKQPAVRGIGAKGRGGEFSGATAQIRLLPAGTLPASGQTGDLFVDSSGGLHYCKAGGSTATWVKLA